MNKKIIIIQILAILLISSIVYAEKVTIAELPKWHFDVIKNDDYINVDIKEIDSETIELTINSKKDIPEEYEWDMALCDVNGVDEVKKIKDKYKEIKSKEKIKDGWCIDQEGNGYNLLKAMKKQDLPYTMRFEIPDDAEEFKLLIGNGTVEIDVTAGSLATAYVMNDNICRTSDGNLHVVYEDYGGDAYYTYSDDEGDSWSGTLINDGGSSKVGIVCKPDGNLTIYWYYYSSGYYFYAKDSNDGGSTWGTSYLLYTGVSYPSCQSDSDGVVHCVITDGDEAFYINSSNPGNEITVNDNTADDSDFCDIEIDQNDCIYIACMGSDGDDLDVWSPCLDGFGDTNRIQINDADYVSASGLANGYGLSISIRDNQLFSVFIDNSDLQLCNTSLTNINVSDCQEIDSAASYMPDIAIDSTGGIHIIYLSNSYGNTAYISFANSTDGINFDIQQQPGDRGYHPSIADSYYPDSNHASNRLYYVWTDSGSDVNFDFRNISSEPVNECNVTADCDTCEKCVSNECVYQTDSEDLKSECGSIQCDGDAGTAYYYGYSSLSCYYRDDVANTNCNGAGACESAADVCPEQGMGDITNVTCDCEDAQAYCFTTYAGVCSNEVCPAIANESQGDTAIDSAISNSLINPLVYEEQDVYIVYPNGTHMQGTFDRIVEENDKVWLLLYKTALESFNYFWSVDDSLNVWENESLTTSQITSQVETLINQTN